MLALDGLDIAHLIKVCCIFSIQIIFGWKTYYIVELHWSEYNTNQQSVQSWSSYLMVFLSPGRPVCGIEHFFLFCQLPSSKGIKGCFVYCAGIEKTDRKNWDPNFSHWPTCHLLRDLWVRDFPLLFFPRNLKTKWALLAILRKLHTANVWSKIHCAW